jgi:two-component system, LytTR family, response regulator
MILRTIIADDEPLAREGIRLRLKKEKDIQIIGEYDSGRTVLAAIKSTKPDLVFLDIQMPVLSGFNVLKCLTPSQYPLIIFITAYNQHAIEAFRMNALDYLLKPIDDKQFHQALAKARIQFKQLQMSQFAERVQSLLANPEYMHENFSPAKQSESLHRIAVRSKTKTYFVKIKDIDWIEAAGDYLYLHAHGEKHLVRKTLSNFEMDLMSSQFLRIHKSSLINISQIRELEPADHGDCWVNLLDGTRLKVSRSRKKALQKAIGIEQ